MNPTRMRPAPWWLMIAGLLLLTAACGTDSTAATSPTDDQQADPPTASEGSFAGQVDGANVLLALLTDGEQVAGYLCDGQDVSAWLRSGEPDADAVTLVGRDGTQHGTVSFTGGQATGQIDLDGATHTFALEPTEGDAGLYRAFADLGDDGTVEAGWILLADGTQTGAINTTGPDGSARSIAPPLDPSAGSLSLPAGGGRTVELAADHLTTGFIEKTIF